MMRTSAHGWTRRSGRAVYAIEEDPKNPDLIKARKKIDEIYAKLESGADFNQLARESSEDQSTAKKGGYLGFFGIYEVIEICDSTNT